MIITQFDNKYLDEMTQLFMDEYSEPGSERVWNLETTKKYLKRDIDNAPEYCLMAIDDNEECVGAVFCRIDPYYTGEMLFVDSLQTKKEYRNKGIAKILLQEVFKFAKQNNLLGVHLLADAREGFPKTWYEGIGFTLSGWAEYEAHWEELERFVNE